MDNRGLESKWLRTTALYRKEQSGYYIQNFTFSVSTEERKSYAFGKTGEKIIII